MQSKSIDWFVYDGNLWWRVMSYEKFTFLEANTFLRTHQNYSTNSYEPNTAAEIYYKRKCFYKLVNRSQTTKSFDLFGPTKWRYCELFSIRLSFFLSFCVEFFSGLSQNRDRPKVKVFKLYEKSSQRNFSYFFAWNYSNITRKIDLNGFFCGEIFILKFWPKGPEMNSLSCIANRWISFFIFLHEIEAA